MCIGLAFAVWLSDRCSAVLLVVRAFLVYRCGRSVGYCCAGYECASSGNNLSRRVSAVASELKKLLKHKQLVSEHGYFYSARYFNGLVCDSPTAKCWVWGQTRLVLFANTSHQFVGAYDYEARNMLSPVFTSIYRYTHYFAGDGFLSESAVWLVAALVVFFGHNFIEVAPSLLTASSRW